MIHNLILALCITAALAVLLAAMWTLIGNKVDTQGGLFSGHIVSRPFDQSLAFRRHSARVVLTTAPEKSLPGGWSLIYRTIRARRDIRLAAR